MKNDTTNHQIAHEKHHQKKKKKSAYACFFLFLVHEIPSDPKFILSPLVNSGATIFIYFPVLIAIHPCLHLTTICHVPLLDSDFLST